MWAHSIGRQVWGVPGPLSSATSAGVHAAIRDRVMDIAVDLKSLVPPTKQNLIASGRELEHIERAIVDVLATSRKSTDSIVTELNQFPAHEVLSALTLLELRGDVTSRDFVWDLVN